MSRQMFEVMDKEKLNASTFKMLVYAPHIAEKARPGQFIIFRAHEKGERIPLTIAQADKKSGGITIIFRVVGKSTQILSQLETGETVLDFVGPLGQPSNLDGLKKVAVIVGGLGSAIAYPQAKYLYDAGAKVDIVAGFRSKNLLVLEEDMRRVSHNFYICTDDGSYGEKGLVTDILKRLLEGGKKYDKVIAVGPLPMMKYVSLLTKEYGISTVASLNTIMVDGTGMCGGCRISVDGRVKFACVDGPEFDAHLVDFDEAIRRSGMYKDEERQQVENYVCKLERADK